MKIKQIALLIVMTLGFFTISNTLYACDAESCNAHTDEKYTPSESSNEHCDRQYKDQTKDVFPDCDKTCCINYCYGKSVTIPYCYEFEPAKLLMGFNSEIYYLAPIYHSIYQSVWLPPKLV
jgi:hypothetical protein